MTVLRLWSQRHRCPPADLRPRRAGGMTWSVCSVCGLIVLDQQNTSEPPADSHERKVK